MNDENLEKAISLLDRCRDELALGWRYDTLLAYIRQLILEADLPESDSGLDSSEKVFFETLHRARVDGREYPPGTRVEILGWAPPDGVGRDSVWVRVVGGEFAGDEILLSSSLVSSFPRKLGCYV